MSQLVVGVVWRDMPNLGAPELLILFWAILIPVGIGYWCMRVYRGKGYSAGAGFAIGFALTLFLSLIGAVVALLIVYLSRPSTPALARGAPVPPPPQTAGPNAQVIATFGPTTGWNGRRIVFDNGALLIEGVGPVSGQGVESYAKNGQIAWQSQAMRDWIADQVKYS